MIPEYAINQWRSYAPWNSMPQVEQDLIISRSLIELFNDAYLSSHLAFRGGTALHKLYLNPQVRYSEGLDLVVPDPYYLDKKVKLVELFSYHKLGLTNKYTHLFGDS